MSSKTTTPGMPQIPAIRQFIRFIPMDILKKPKTISHTSSIKKPEAMLNINLKIKRIGADSNFIKQKRAATARTTVRISDISISSPLHKGIILQFNFDFGANNKLGQDRWTRDKKSEICIHINMDTSKTGFCQAVEEFSRKKKIFAAGAGCKIMQPAFCTP